MEKVVIVNLTPHDIHLYRGDELVETLSRAEWHASASAPKSSGKSMVFPFPKLLWEIIGLPEPQPEPFMCERSGGAGGGWEANRPLGCKRHRPGQRWSDCRMPWFCPDLTKDPKWVFFLRIHLLI